MAKKFGGKFINQLTVEDVEDYQAWRKSAGVTNSTVNHETAVLKTAINRAVRNGHLPPTNLQHFRKLKENPPRERYLNQSDPNELDRLLKACAKRKDAPHLLPIVLIFLNTGMRPSEIFRMKWTDIDFSLRIIFVRRSKNGKNLRKCMNDMVVDVLSRLPKHPTSPYVFCNKEGQPLKGIRTSWGKALKEAKIEGYHFYDNRHTFASFVRQKNTSDLGLLKDLMGHSSADMVLRYAHIGQSAGHKAVDSLIEMPKDMLFPTQN